MLQEEVEEDVALFDRTSLLGSGGGSTRRRGQKKGFSTFALCGAFFGVGLALAIPGPTLNYLKCNVGATLKTISYIFPARSLGYLIGSLLGGFLFDRLVHRSNKLVSIGLILAAITLGAAPWSSSLSFLCIFLSITSISMGFLDTGGNVILLRIWEKESGPYMQALHFAFGVGACISPLVAAPFLSSTGASCNVSEVLPYGNITTESLVLSPMHKRQAPLPTTTRGMTFPINHTENATRIGNLSLSTTVKTDNVTSTIPLIVTSHAITTTATTEVPKKPKNTGQVVSENDNMEVANGQGMGSDVDDAKHNPPPLPPSKTPPTSPTTVSPTTTATTSSESLTGANNGTSSNNTLFESNTQDSLNGTVNTTLSETAAVTSSSTGETTLTTVLVTKKFQSAVTSTPGRENSISVSTSFTSSSTESTTTAPQGTSKKSSNESSPSIVTSGTVKVTPTAANTTPTTLQTTPATSQTTSTTSQTTPSTSQTTSTTSQTTPSTSQTTSTTSQTTPTTSQTTPTTSQTTLSTSQTMPTTSSITPPIPQTTSTTSEITPTTSQTTITNSTSVPKSSDLESTPASAGATEPTTPLPEYPKPGSANSTDNGDDESLLEKAENMLMSISSVQFSYLVIAIVMLVFGLMFCCLPENSTGPDRSKRRKSENDLHEVAEAMMAPPLSYKVKLMTAVFIFFFLYVGTEVSYGQFLATFSIHHSNFTERQGAYLTAVYWGMFALARGMSVPLAKFLSPTVMLIISITITVCSSVGLTIATAAVHNVGALWVLSGLLGVGMAAIFPTGVLWVEGYVKVTSKMAAVFVCASALGEMAIPAIVGYFIEVAGPLTLMYTTLVCVLGCMLTFVSMCCFASTKTNEYRQVGLSETANAMHMQQFEFSDSDETDSEPILFKRNGASKTQ